MFQSRLSYIKIVGLIFVMVMTNAAMVTGADVTLRWDPNDPAPEGYRVFARQSGQSYDYAHPIWENSQTTCTLTGLVEGVTYHFVVRAYEGTLESPDSEEVSYTPALAVPNQPPAADAGPDQLVDEGASVTLDGAGSHDVDGTITAYRWTQTGGSTVALSGVSSAVAGFVAPVVGVDGETLHFRLTVTDDDGSTAVASTSVNVRKSASTDRDGDGVADVLDRFPDDPAEWADNDSDGIGDNQDPDDDNDGMPDAWETAHGLDPMTDDAALDADGDGVSNIDEYTAGSDPVTLPTNKAPEAPVVDTAVQTERVSLTPVLVTDAYFDSDYDDHFQSQWQISTQADFAILVLDKTSRQQLTAYTVGKMVLDLDTVYYWRVRFIDSRNAASDWSATATFTTIAPEDSSDKDLNGIPDEQEVGAAVDVNENGVSDVTEDTIMTVNAVEGQTIVGVETHSENVTLVALESLSADTVPDKSVNLGFGLVGFKLYLLDGVTTATVTIHFSTPMPKSAGLYKYAPDTGWQAYANAVFAANRKSVTMLLEDGGMGDEDGVVNGIIVDPSAIAYTDVDDSAALTTGGTSVSGGSGDACFISSGIRDLKMMEDADAARLSLAMTILLLAAGLAVAALRWAADR